jgi:hypothetical protein
MEMYDPLCETGSIVVTRDRNGQCLLLEACCEDPNKLLILKIWQVQEKKVGSGSKRSIEEPCVVKEKRWRPMRPKKNKLILIKDEK